MFGRNTVGQRIVGQHEPVPEDVRGNVLHVLGQGLVAAPQQGYGAGGRDQA